MTTWMLGSGGGARELETHSNVAGEEELDEDGYPVFTDDYYDSGSYLDLFPSRNVGGNDRRGDREELPAENALFYLCNLPPHMRQLALGLCLNRMPVLQLELGLRHGLPPGTALDAFRHILEELVVFAAHEMRVEALVARLGLSADVTKEFPTPISVFNFRSLEYVQRRLGCPYETLLESFDLRTVLDTGDMYALHELEKCFTTDLLRRFDDDRIAPTMMGGVRDIASIEEKIRRVYTDCVDHLRSSASLRGPRRLRASLREWQARFGGVDEAVTLPSDAAIVALGDTVLAPCPLQSLVAFVGYLWIRNLLGDLSRHRHGEDGDDAPMSDRTWLEQFDELSFAPTRLGVLPPDVIAALIVLTSTVAVDPTRCVDSVADEARDIAILERFMLRLCDDVRSLRPYLDTALAGLTKELAAQVGLSLLSDSQHEAENLPFRLQIEAVVTGRWVCSRFANHWRAESSQRRAAVGATANDDGPRRYMQALTTVEHRFTRAYEQASSAWLAQLKLLQQRSRTTRPRSQSQTSFPVFNEIQYYSDNDDEDAEDSVHSIGSPLPVAFTASGGRERPTLPSGTMPITAVQASSGSTTAGQAVDGGSTSPARRRNISLPVGRPPQQVRHPQHAPVDAPQDYMAMPWMGVPKDERGSRASGMTRSRPHSPGPALDKNPFFDASDGHHTPAPPAPALAGGVAIGSRRGSISAPLLPSLPPSFTATTTATTTTTTPWRSSSRPASPRLGAAREEPSPRPRQASTGASPRGRIVAPSGDES